MKDRYLDPNVLWSKIEVNMVRHRTMVLLNYQAIVLPSISKMLCRIPVVSKIMPTLWTTTKTT